MATRFGCVLCMVLSLAAVARGEGDKPSDGPKQEASQTQPSADGVTLLPPVPATDPGVPPLAIVFRSVVRDDGSRRDFTIDKEQGKFQKLAITVGDLLAGSDAVRDVVKSKECQEEVWYSIFESELLIAIDKNSGGGQWWGINSNTVEVLMTICSSSASRDNRVRAAGLLVTRHPEMAKKTLIDLYGTVEPHWPHSYLEDYRQVCYDPVSCGPGLRALGMKVPNDIVLMSDIGAPKRESGFNLRPDPEQERIYRIYEATWTVANQHLRQLLLDKEYQKLEQLTDPDKYLEMLKAYWAEIEKNPPPPPPPTSPKSIFEESPPDHEK